YAENQPFLIPSAASDLGVQQGEGLAALCPNRAFALRPPPQTRALTGGLKNFPIDAFGTMHPCFVGERITARSVDVASGHGDVTSFHVSALYREWSIPSQARRPRVGRS